MRDKKRIYLALKAINKLSDLISDNGGIYSGSMVPNFTTISGILVADDTELEEVEKYLGMEIYH